MSTFYWALLALLLAAATGWWFYRRTPEQRWRSDVIYLWTMSHVRQLQEESALTSLAVERTTRERSLLLTTLHSMLRGVPAEALEAYSGIGPVTVGRLRESGFADLLALQNLPEELPGIAGKRLADVAAAVEHLTEQVHEQLRAGMIADPGRLGASLAHLRLEFEVCEARSWARLKAIKEARSLAERLLPTARQIRFSTYLLSLIGWAQLPSLLQGVLPDLESALQAANASVAAVPAATALPPAAAAPPVAAVPAATPVAVPAPVPGNDLFAVPHAAFAPAAPAAAPARREEPPEVTLEIDPMLTLTADLVRRQYHLLSERYDSDKLKPLGSDFVALAQAKRDRVAAAAAVLLASMGEKLEPPGQPVPPNELRHNPELDALFGV